MEYSVHCIVYAYIIYAGQGVFMSFWDVARKAGKVVLKTAEGMNDKAKELKELRSELEQKSDDELIKISKAKGFSGASAPERTMSAVILKKRGIEPGSY